MGNNALVLAVRGGSRPCESMLTTWERKWREIDYMTLYITILDMAITTDAAAWSRGHPKDQELTVEPSHDAEVPRLASEAAVDI
jgi:hypothetical protein